MSDGAFHALVRILRPRLPRPGLSAEVRTALALRYMGGGGYVVMCSAFGVHSASVYRNFGQLVSGAAMGVPDGGLVGRNGVQFETAAGGKGCSEQCHAARCVSIGLRGRLLRHVRIVVCRHTGEELSDCRQFVLQFLQERKCKHTRRRIPRSQTVYRGIKIRGDPAYVCTSIPSRDGLGQ